MSDSKTGENRKDPFGIGSLACYDSLDQVGEGTYGYVYKARDIRSGEPVALKRLIIHRETSGFPLNAVREIKFLKSLSHKNIVKLKDIATSKGCEHLEVTIKTDTKSDQQQDSEKNSENKKRKETLESYAQAKDIMRICGNLYLVFEFIEHDIGGLIDSKYKFPVRAIKSIMKQLFEVLDYLSDKKIVHRDIKSSNILITNRHQIKLADFGLARSFQNTVDGRELKVDMTNNVITMWYRPPELLLGAVRYGPAIDMWSAGCVMAELELGRPLFPGKTEVEQLDLICRSLGTPSEDSWPGMSQLPQYEPLLKSGANKYVASLKSTYGNKIPDISLNLMERVLVFDPSRRSSAKIILTNKYFLVNPLPPIDPADLEPLSVAASGVSFHEYKTKQQRKAREEEARKQAEGGSAATTATEGDAAKTVTTSAAAATVIVAPPPPPPSSFVAPPPPLLNGVPPPPPVSFPYSVFQSAAPIAPAIPVHPHSQYPYPYPAAAAPLSYYPTPAAPPPPGPPPPPPAVAAPPVSSSMMPSRPSLPSSSSSHSLGEWTPSIPPPGYLPPHPSYGGARSDSYQRPSYGGSDRHHSSSSDSDGRRRYNDHSTDRGTSHSRGGSSGHRDKYEEDRDDRHRVGNKRSYH